MRKIYKRGTMENRPAIACVLFASLICTGATALVLLQATEYLSVAVIAAAAGSIALAWRIKPYEASGSGKHMVALLAVNLLILICIAALF
ncbi:MAG: hypothetical protein KGI04_01080 [Candidatus Micrarchaeota archaeon]|nr:hypothetical protein [Candidatus Micrarchaeota archaeon]